MTQVSFGRLRIARLPHLAEHSTGILNQFCTVRPGTRLYTIDLDKMV